MTNDNIKSLQKTIFTAIAGVLVAAPTASVLASGTSVCNADQCFLTAKLPPELNAETIGDGAGSESLIEYDQGVWQVGGVTIANLGFAGWKPVVGDWDGDGYDNIGVYSNGFWVLKNNWLMGELGDATTTSLGSAGSEPVTGNWTGTGGDSIGVYDDGQYTLRMDMSDSSADVTIDFGNLPFDDADADGPKPTVAVFSGTRGSRSQVGIILGDTLKFSANNSTATYDFYASGQFGLAERIVDHGQSDLFPITVSFTGLGLSQTSGDGIAYFPRPGGSNIPTGHHSCDATTFSAECAELQMHPPNPDTGITMPIPIGGPDIP